jgi:hypothetical protein
LTIRASLDDIAADEARHADLSWRFVEWMLRANPTLKPEAKNCFAQGLTQADVVDNAVDGKGIRWPEKYGLLVPSTRRRVREQVIRDEIKPQMDALFSRLRRVASSSEAASDVGP